MHMWPFKAVKKIEKDWFDDRQCVVFLQVQKEIL